MNCTRLGYRGCAALASAVVIALAAGCRARIGGGQHVATIPYDSTTGRFDLDSLRLSRPSRHHGAGDAQRLAIVDTTSGALSYGPLSTITAVDGVEQIPESAFRRQPVPIAVIEVDSAYTAGYPKLGLAPGTNYWLVQQVDSATWKGWIQPAKPGAKAVAFPVTANADSVRPVPTARWEWSSKDEGAWGYCGGRCCSISPRTQ